MGQNNFKGYEASQRAEMTAEALQNLARYLAKIPGRKNLIWFAENFPIGFFPNTVSTSATIPGRQNAGTGERARTANLGSPTAVAPQDIRMKETTDLLTVSRVAIYPIGAQGAEYPESQRDGTSAMFSANGSPEQQAESAANHAAMSELASETGGEAIYNNNDFSGIITRVIQNGSHYYTLSYTPNKNMDGQFHSIQVKLAERGYKLSYRHGYYALDEITPQSSPKSSRPSKSLAVSKASLDASPTANPNPLQQLMKRGAPSSTQIIYAVRVEPANPQPAANAEREGANPQARQPIHALHGRLPDPIERSSYRSRIRRQPSRPGPGRTAGLRPQRQTPQLDRQHRQLQPQTGNLRFHREVRPARPHGNRHPPRRSLASNRRLRLEYQQSRHPRNSTQLT